MNRSRLSAVALVVVLGVAVLLVWRSSRSRRADGSAYIAATPEQEIAFGLHAAPLFAERYGGLLTDPARQPLLQQIGSALTVRGEAAALPHALDFHLLADSQTVLAVALLGGQVFVTRALFDRVRDRQAQLAAVLAHEVAHVLARHPVEYLARTEIDNGFTGAAVLASYAPEDQENRQRAVVITAITSLINMQHDEDQEIEADARALELLHAAGFDVGALAEFLYAVRAADPQRMTAFIAVHPITARRLQLLENATERMRPDTTGTSTDSNSDSRDAQAFRGANNALS